MHNAQGAERALWTHSVLLCRDLTSRSFFREMTAELKNASSVNRREECKAQKASDQSGFVQPGRDLQPQTTWPPPANQEPESAPLRPIRGHAQDPWPLAFQSLGLLNSPRPLSSPPSSENSLAIVCVLSDPLKSQQVKWPTGEHDLWSSKCRVTLQKH